MHCTQSYRALSIFIIFALYSSHIIELQKYLADMYEVCNRIFYITRQ